MTMEADKPKNGIIAGLVIATCITIIAVIVGVNQYFDGLIHKEVGKKIEKSGLADLTKLRAEEGGHLTGYTWVDEKKQIVRIPLDRATQMVLGDYAKPVAVNPTGPAPAPTPVPNK